MFLPFEKRQCQHQNMSTVFSEKDKKVTNSVIQMFIPLNKSVSLLYSLQVKDSVQNMAACLVI